LIPNRGTLFTSLLFQTLGLVLSPDSPHGFRDINHTLAVLNDDFPLADHSVWWQLVNMLRCLTDEEASLICENYFVVVVLLPLPMLPHSQRQENYREGGIESRNVRLVSKQLC
jgi:hypothetical protein